MHMADALLSPAVGGALWAATAGAVAVSGKRVKQELDDRRVPLMGVLGAFIFAAQMINFTIPGTGSSGHVSGALILAVVLGPWAAFLTMASIVAVQALFFADGGLLALGCNIFNMGFWGCFVAYPLVYRRIAGDDPTPGRLTAACLAAALVTLQLGPFSVVLETYLSGVSSLPFRAFVALMQTIHLAIGVVEGLVSAAVLNFVRSAQPDLLRGPSRNRPAPGGGLRKVLIGLGASAVVLGGALSWFASENPDGLEWSIAKLTGRAEVEAAGAVHEAARKLQEKTAVLPDYGSGKEPSAVAAPPAAQTPAGAGTGLAGLVGGAITLGVAALVGLVLRRRRPPV